MGRIIRGGFAGLVATAVMSAVVAVGKALGLLEVPPPKQITGEAASKSGVQPQQVPQPAFDAGWIAAHFGYGAGCGAIYGLVRGAVPGGRTVSGIIFGLLVWSVSYLGLLPALQLYPLPSRDRSSRTAVMIAAHIVFGAVLGRTAQRR